MTLKVGIIGFGQVGQAMAGVLAQKHSVRVFDLNRGLCERHPLIEGGTASAAASAGDLASSVDVLILCLPTPKASRAVAADIAASVRPGLLVLETSTVSPEDVFALRDALEPGGATIVDTAVIGGIKALSEGKAVFLVGAPEDRASATHAILDLLAAEIFYFGKPGGGMRAKIVANGVSHAVYVVLAESLAVAAAQELPMDVMYRLLARESGMMRPLTHRINERLFRGDFQGGMSTANARKDSSLFLEAAGRLNVPVFASQAAHTVYEIAACEGMAGDDYAIVAKLWEKWSGIKLAGEPTT
ncbi:NAD(P)-dependent oxidoreductase [Microvirga sp. P5_D2]